MNQQATRLSECLQMPCEPFASNFEMLKETLREFELLTHDSTRDDWQARSSLNAHRMAASAFDTIPFSALINRCHLCEIESRYLLILFFIHVSSKYRSHFVSDEKESCRTNDEPWIPFRTILERSGFEPFLDAESIVGLLDLKSKLITRNLIQMCFYIDRDDAIENPDVMITPDAVRLIRGPVSNEDSVVTIERPTTRFEQVILPEDTKKKLLTLIENHEDVQLGRAALDVDNTIEYGQSSVIMFHGPSGTGKTMMARAISNLTGMPLVIPRESFLGNLRYCSEKQTASVERLFFETERHGGILFLDECEELLEENASALQAFLRQIEQTRCIVILSTNKPNRINASFDRRIALKIEFELPSAAQRFEIWKALIPPKIRFAPDVDLHEFSMLFPMTGGYIKNAVLYAINRAVHRNPDEPCLNREDLDEACRNQEAHLGIGVSWRKFVSVTESLDDIYLSQEDIRIARRIARRISGIQRVMNRREGSVKALPGPKVLVHAATGSRSLQIANAIGRELSPVVCVIEAREILTRGCVDDLSESTARVVSRIITSNSGSGKLIVINDASLLLGDSEYSTETAPDMLPSHAIRDMIMNHPAAIVFVVSGKFRLTKSLAPQFIERFSESLDKPENRLENWRGILREFSVEIPCGVESSLLLQYALNPDEIRRVIVAAIWEESDEGDIRTIPVETLVRIAARQASSRHESVFSIADRS